jgi:Asp/Glu/hydantoin racemase
MSLGFGTSLERSLSSESLRGLGAKVLDLEDQDKVAAAVISRRSQNPARSRGASAVIFGGGGTLFLLGVLSKTGGRTWFLSGEVVVDCW